MLDDLSRAQHYRLMERQMRELAARETEVKLRGDLLKLADQYRRVADKLVGKVR